MQALNASYLLLLQLFLLSLRLFSLSSLLLSTRSRIEQRKILSKKTTKQAIAIEEKKISIQLQVSRVEQTIKST